MDATTAVLLFFVLVLAVLFLEWGKRNSNLPPGPRALPLIGNMLQLAGRDFRQVCKEYRKVYGDLFTVRIFNKTVIIANGFDTITDIGEKNGDVFSDRPRNDGLNAVMRGKGIIFANGEIWKHNRRFVIRTLRDFGMGKRKLQPVIHEEISHFLAVLEKEQEQPFDIEYFVTMAISNIISSLVFGRRFDYRDEAFIDNVRRLSELFATNFPMKVYWMRFIPGDPFRVLRGIGHFKHLSSFYRSKVQEHQQDFDSNGLRDVIDAYIKQIKLGENTGESTLFNENEIVRIVHELFIAGTETTATALRFGLICMLRNQDIQEKLASDVRKVVPDNRLPDMDDVKNLPYFQASVSETLRRASIGPFAVPHAAESDQQYRGYTIPKSATILLNLESVLHDEALWTEPGVFNPSRFMKENISQAMTKALVPFGIGPRICPGEALGRMELNLFLSAMLQRFKFLPPEGEDPPSMATKLGLTAVPPPFKLRAIKRI